MQFDNSTCEHGRRIDQNCRLCELIVEKGLRRTNPPTRRSSVAFWLFIIVVLVLAELVWFRQ